MGRLRGRDLQGRASSIDGEAEAGERGHGSSSERQTYGRVTPLTSSNNHDQLDRTNRSGNRSNLKVAAGHTKAIGRDMEDGRQGDGVGTSTDRSDRRPNQKHLLEGVDRSPELGSGNRRRGADALSGAGSGINERRRVCSTFDPVRKVSTIEQLVSSVEHAREHEHLAVVLLANPSCKMVSMMHIPPMQLAHNSNLLE